MSRRPLTTLIALAITPLLAGQPLRLIDVHTHVLENGVTVDDEIARLKKAGLAATVMMSSSPEMLQDLTKRYKGYVIPFVSIAREPGALGVRLGPDTNEALKKLLDTGVVCGYGELGTNGSLAVASLGANDPAAE